MADETNFDLGYNPLSSPEAVSVPSSPPDTVPANPSIQTSHSKSQGNALWLLSKAFAEIDFFYYSYNIFLFVCLK